MSAAGYRFYDEQSLVRLGQILFYRELELPLAEICRLVDSPDTDALAALKKHIELLRLRREHLERLITAAESALKGENDMKDEKENLTAYGEAKNKYAAEVKQRWGATDAYEQSERKSARRTETENAAVLAGLDDIFAGFAALRGGDSASPAARAAVEGLKKYISDNMYECTDEILAGLGLMYVGDERFKANIDRHGEGTAQFAADAIAAYCKK